MDVKVLLQDGNLDGRDRRQEVRVRPAEMGGLGQDRDCCRPAPYVGRCLGARVEGGIDGPLRRRPSLHLGDDPHLFATEHRGQSGRGESLASRDRQCSLPLEEGFRPLPCFANQRPQGPGRRRPGGGLHFGPSSAIVRTEFGESSGRLPAMIESNARAMSLTKRQHEILSFLSSYSEERGYAPSFEEIAERFNYNSLATVHEHLSNLERKGYIK